MRLVWSSAIVAALAACASTPPPRELLDARAAYSHAQSSVAATAEPGELHEARLALDRAEAKYADDAKGAETRDLAYVAHRKALSVEARARADVEAEAAANAKAELARIQRDAAMQELRALEKQKEALVTDRQRVASERAARVDAEKRTNAELSRIDGVTTRMSDRGLLITLPGNALFDDGRSDLIMSANARLTALARALKSDKRTIIVVDHSDTAPKGTKLLDLSRERADTIRTSLYKLGVDPSRFRSEGKGDAEPITSAKTREGRTTNCRVEIILAPVDERTERTD